MKVRISYIVEVDDRFRRAIRHHYGETGLATRDELKRWFKQNGETMNDDIVFYLNQDESESADRRAGE